MKTKNRILSMMVVLSMVFGALGVMNTTTQASADTGNAEKLVIGATVTGHFEHSADGLYNYYYFETDSDNAFYSIAFTYEAEPVNPEVSISSEIGGDSIVKRTGSGTIDCKNLLKPNSTYYIKVYSDVFNPVYDYTLKVSKYADDNPDTAIEAKSISVDEVVKGNIENSADLDVFAFTAGTDKYKLTTSASDNVQFFVYEDELLTTQLMSGKGTKSLDLDKLLSAGNTYYVGVKGTVNGFNAESYMFKLVKATSKSDSDDSDVTVEIPKVPSVVITPAKKKVTLKWKKSKGASGYQIYRSTKKKSGYKCVKKITKGSTVFYTDKKVKSGKTYYYKIRAYKKVGGTTKYGGWSPVKKVKVK